MSIDTDLDPTYAVGVYISIYMLKRLIEVRVRVLVNDNNIFTIRDLVGYPTNTRALIMYDNLPWGRSGKGIKNQANYLEAALQIFTRCGI